MKKYVCIHGHFYQPPRENAWLEEIELQESAHPFHDWNERISFECYGPNTASRILNGNGKIKDISNNYSRISFNVGPTLLSWMQKNDQETYEGILQADRISLERYGGHGSAMAQVYNHIIMPLANRRDKETQVIWGIRDFEYHYDRIPEGMWLAETAVDIESLDIMAANGIRFTVLAPHQAAELKLKGYYDFQPVKDVGLNTKIPYRCQLPSGREIFIFFYDGGLSQSVAFNGLLDNGKRFADDLLAGFDSSSQEYQLVNIATDGESYGHHHHHGDMALSYCLDYIDRGKVANLTNYGEFLDLTDTIGECKIIEDSSWSCVHGVERWKADCGCNSGGRPDWNQKWREPLRKALDDLRDRLNESFETLASEVLEEPWEARNKYIEVILDRQSKTVHSYLNDHPDRGAQINRGMRWLEMQRNTLLMFTSCGWFFDEVSGIETTQIMQYACRAIQLHRQLTGVDLEDYFIGQLENVPSNLPEMANAAKIYKKFVIPSRLDLERVGMHYAVSTLFESDHSEIDIFNHTATSEAFDRWDAGIQRLVCGQVKIRSDVTYSEKQFTYAVLYLGQHHIIGNISMDMDAKKYADIRDEFGKAFNDSRIGDLIGAMQKEFGPKKYTMWHLFRDQKNKVINQIMEESLRQVENSFKKIYNRDYSMINMIRSSDVPVPKAYLSTIEFVLNADLRHCLQTEKIDLKELERLSKEFEKWGVKVDDSLAIEKHAGERIHRTLTKLLKNPNQIDRLKRINEFFEYLKTFQLSPDLSKSQNDYFYLSKMRKTLNLDDPEEWSKEFSKLGDYLQINIS